MYIQKKKNLVQCLKLLDQDFQTTIKQLWSRLERENVNTKFFSNDAAYSCSQSRVEHFAVHVQLNEVIVEDPPQNDVWDENDVPPLPEVIVAEIDIEDQAAENDSPDVNRQQIIVNSKKILFTHLFIG